jgi:lipoyl(octanoyl) transferase
VHNPIQGLPLDLTCHVFPYAASSGPANMALDEALLEWVAGGAGPACLRTYSWTTPTLSLGYFQPFSEVQVDPRFQSVPVVRRLTGGGAIWHHYEVTYALVVAGNHPLARPSTGLYRAVHGAIADALGAVGISAARRGDGGGSGHGDQKRPLLCFTDTDPEDIVSGDVKIVGSAQRRRGGAVLQHGSLILARSCCTPELLGVCDVADESVANHNWSDRLLECIPSALGLRCVDGSLPSEVRDRAAELERTRYENPAWTALR